MMKPARAFYSIVQYCPDLGRMEAANIGVLLFCHARSFCGVRMSSSNARVERFFGSRCAGDWACIDSFRTGIAERLKLESDDWLAMPAAHGRYSLMHFIDGRANQIQLTPLRPMMVCDPPEQELDRLFRALVE